VGANYSLTIVAAEIHQRQNVFKQIRHKNSSSKSTIERKNHEREREREREREEQEGRQRGRAILSHKQFCYREKQTRRESCEAWVTICLYFFLSFFLSPMREKRGSRHTQHQQQQGGGQQRQQPPHDSPISKCPHISVIIPSCKRIPRFASSSKNSPLKCEQFSFFCERAGAIQVRIQWKRRKGQSSTVITRPAAAAIRRIGLLHSSAEIRSLLYSHQKCSSSSTAAQHRTHVLGALFVSSCLMLLVCSLDIAIRPAATGVSCSSEEIASLDLISRSMSGVRNFLSGSRSIDRFTDLRYV